QGPPLAGGALRLSDPCDPRKPAAGGPADGGPPRARPRTRLDRHRPRRRLRAGRWRAFPPGRRHPPERRRLSPLGGKDLARAHRKQVAVVKGGVERLWQRAKARNGALWKELDNLGLFGLLPPTARQLRELAACPRICRKLGDLALCQSSCGALWIPWIVLSTDSHGLARACTRLSPCGMADLSA